MGFGADAAGRVARRPTAYQGRSIAMIEEALLTFTPRFSTRRLLEEDVEQAYAPATRRAPHG